MLTILLATRNRAGQLRQVLERYCDLQSPAGGWKAIIVDNGSSDDTRGTVESFSTRIPVQYLREDRPGKTVALNTGLSAVEGDLIVLTDDDILVLPDWLVRYRADANTHPEFSIFAGPEKPRWPKVPPAWVTSHPGIAGAIFAISSRAFETGPLERYGDVIGGNFAVRASVFDEGYRFDANIGPRGASFAMGSEKEFLDRVVKAGHRVWWSAELAVEHMIRLEQYESSSIWRRAVRYGRGAYRQSVYLNGEPTFLLGWPRYAIRELVEGSLSIMMAFLRRQPEQHFDARWKAACAWGQLVEGRQMHREKAPVA